MSRPASPTVRRRQLASSLRRLRINAGKTLEEAAAELENSAATISRWENNARIPGARDVRDLCAFYGVGDPKLVDDLMSWVTAARQSGWWEDYEFLEDASATYIGLEAAATELHEYHGLLIPGLLQTAAYAARYLTDAVNPGLAEPYGEDEIRERVEIRLERQTILAPAAGLHYFAVLDEAAFRRTVGGAGVMADQLQHMLELSEDAHVDIRMLTQGAGAHPGQQGDFSILTLPEDVSDIVYCETMAGQIFLDSPESITRHRAVFTRLTALALDRSASRDAMARIRDEVAPP